MGCLVAYRLEFGFGLGLDCVAGAVNFCRQFVQVLIQRGQLALHGFDEFILLGEGVIFHVLGGLLRFGFDRVELLRGGFSLVASNNKSRSGKECDQQCFVSHTQSITGNSDTDYGVKPECEFETCLLIKSLTASAIFRNISTQGFQREKTN